jgi:hypothetical protein
MDKPGPVDGGSLLGGYARPEGFLLKKFHADQYSTACRHFEASFLIAEIERDHAASLSLPLCD